MPHRIPCSIRSWLIQLGLIKKFTCASNNNRKKIVFMQIMGKIYVGTWWLWWPMVVSHDKWIWTMMAFNGHTWFHELTNITIGQFGQIVNFTNNQIRHIQINLSNNSLVKLVNMQNATFLIKLWLKKPWFHIMEVFFLLF